MLMLKMSIMKLMILNTVNTCCFITKIDVYWEGNTNLPMGVDKTVRF
jgi:hypothetical protein